jgi:hypothetical protein
MVACASVDAVSGCCRGIEQRRAGGARGGRGGGCVGWNRREERTTWRVSAAEWLRSQSRVHAQQSGRSVVLARCCCSAAAVDPLQQPNSHCRLQDRTELLPIARSSICLFHWCRSLAPSLRCRFLLRWLATERSDLAAADESPQHEAGRQPAASATNRRNTDDESQSALASEDNLKE